MGCKIIVNCCDHHHSKRHKQRARRIQFTSIQLDRFTKIEGDLMAITITDSQQFVLAAQGVDKKGKPTELDGAVAFISSDPNLLVATPIDNLSATITVGPLTGVTLPVTAQITAEGDADLGAGVVPVLGVLDVTIVAGQAVNISLTPGTPTETP